MLEACRVADDTLGIIYGRKLFEYAQSREEPLLMFVSGLHCALYYAATAKDISELRPYIDAMRSQPKGFDGAIPMVYAQFFYNHGDYQKAEETIQEVSSENDADILVLYAEILNKQQKYSESEDVLRRIGSDMVLGNLSCQKKIMRLHVDNMAAVGNWKEAYLKQKEYEAFKDSIERSATLDLTKRYRIEYEVYAKDREILEQQMRIQSLYIGISAIILFILGAAVTYYLWHRRRNRFYKDIVRQNRDFIERQNILSERIAYRDSRIAELEQSNANPVRHSKISDEKAEEIFDRIQYLADNKQVWRDVNITRDSFADMVGCNRTYFSEVLKTKTGMGYSQFMNSCRIREAVRVLSNPEDDTPLKELATDLGFLTIQTFYTQFKNDIGMSPSAFRKAAKG